MKKTVAFIFIFALIASCLIMAKNVSAQSKPAIPQFSIKLVDYSYNVPATYGIDQYTGKEVVTGGGYYVRNKTIDISITNQQFTSFIDSSGNQTNLYYNLRVRGHFGDDSDWTEFYSPYSQRQREGVLYASEIAPIQSDSQYTVISIPNEYQSNSTLDIQVQAMAGYYTQYYPYAGVGGYGWRFTGEASDWSSTQTITISETSASPFPTPSVPELPVLAILPLLITAPLIGKVVWRRSAKK